MDKSIETIAASNGDLIAIIVRAGYEAKESHFITPDSALQNVGYFNYSKGHVVKPHYHPESQRVIHGTPEVVIVKKGSIRLVLYDNNQTFLQEEEVGEGDMFLLISGGHAEVMKEETTVLVIKQGPYLREGDKVHFDGANV